MQNKKIIRWSITAGLFGNALEWYDFILYAYFAPLFAQLFFPAKSQYLALLSTFGIFASGFFARPLGGFLLGRYGDHAGRRKALVASIIIMTTSTFLIALLPTYAQVGFLAPILLTLLRIVQGIAVGGELTSAATFLVEHASPHRRGLVGSLILCTAFFGMLVGSAVTTTLGAIFTQKSLWSLGWRVSYLLGGVLGFLGIYLRIKSIETPQFLTLSKEELMPTKALIKNHFKELFLAILFTSVMALGNYILIAYTTTYLVRFEKFKFEDAMLINFISLFALTWLVPVFGWLSDKLGRKPVFRFGIISMVLSIMPIFMLLTGGTFLSAFIAEILLSFVLATINAVVPIIIVEMFPTEVRATGSSIAYNISQAVFGGTAPLFSLLLVELTGYKIAPGGYLLVCALAAAIGLYFLKASYNYHLARSS